MAPTDQAALVAVIKQRLEDRGLNLSGPDGAFEITRRVAWELRDQGAGVLSKTTGNNAHGFAVDIVCFRDGTYADCLVDAGGANTPAWQINGGVIDVSRWTAPSDPGDEQPAPAPTPTPEPPRPTSDDPLRDAVLQFLEQYGPTIDALEANTNAVLELSRKLDAFGKNGVRVHF
jgi:hypothetical protein